DAAAQVIGDANDAMQRISASSNKISSIIGLIDDIAFQTNLLALNASVEAARAGEAGKGFAVVASEVKSLANQTAKATEEISQKINAIQGATSTAVGAIGSIGENIRRINEISTTIARINEISTSIATAMEEQGAATTEIARNVQQASIGTREVSETIVAVNASASNAGEEARQVLEATNELSRQSITLRTEVERFLVRVRAG
ncbi:MAG: methyl-accepting chemotaxis protein, partial [Alphaproteobacteria bacterium]